jgi:hypothetical protein
MIPYQYSVVRCRDATVRGELKNVGLLVVSPAQRKAWLRSRKLDSRAHLVGDDAAFVRALMECLEEEAREVAKEGTAARVHDWMRSRARVTEDAVSLSAPALGIARDLDQEVRRLAEAYLGKTAGGRSAAERVQTDVLRSLNLHQSFKPEEFEGGPATWRFPRVRHLERGVLIFNALQFTQRTPEKLIESAWTNVGRSAEVEHYGHKPVWLTLALGPAGGDAGRAFTRALQVMADAELNVVEPTPEGIAGGLAKFGLLAGQSSRAEA